MGSVRMDINTEVEAYPVVWAERDEAGRYEVPVEVAQAYEAAVLELERAEDNLLKAAGLERGW